jgi:hypothetical protein
MASSPAENVHLMGRRGTYMLILGVIVGMLATGLAIPFVFGTPLGSASSGGVNPLGALSTSSSGAHQGVGGASPLGSSANGTGVLTGAGAVDAGSAASGLGGAAGAAGSAGGNAAGNAAGNAGGSAGSGGAPGVAPGGATGGGGGAGSTALTASDRGVTATTITVAFLVADLGGVGQFGFSVPGYDPQQQEGYLQAFINNANANGGLLGRKIVPVYVEYDPTDEDSEEAACLTATQDHTVFAAVDSPGGLSFEAQLCFTQQNHTPLLDTGSFGEPEQFYAESDSNLFTIDQSGLRELGNMAHLLATEGLLKGKKIGILDRQFAGTVDTVTDGMVDVLQQLGYQVTYRVDMSMDDGTAASQVPIAAEEMQAHGVTAIMDLTDFITGTEFVQAADKSGYRPEYFASDFEANTNDTAVSAMPSSFQAIAVTTMRTGEWREGIPEPAVDASCRETYAGATRTNLARSDPDYQAMLIACGLVDILARGIHGAGPTLTKAGFDTSVQQIGSIPFPFFGGFSYKPGKYDGGDLVRTLVYQSSCSCWMPHGAFVEPTY